MLRRFKIPSKLFVLILILVLSACESPFQLIEAVESIEKGDVSSELSYPIDLADYSDVAKQLISLSPDGVAIGEVHGQIAGILLLEAVMTQAVEQGRNVLVLQEITPDEAGLNLDDVPARGFRVIDMTSKNLPFWKDNIDKRATWELNSFFNHLSKTPNVELSYLWDSRLNPPPNRLKAHGMAERWQIAKVARPDSYIIALAGNYHTSINDDYPLSDTNSLCRYAAEVYGFRPSCVAVDNWDSPNANCQKDQQAVLIKGSEIFEDWDYMIQRPDRCVVQAHWVNAGSFDAP